MRLTVLAGLLFLAGVALAQGPEALLDDARAQVILVEVSSEAPYTLQAPSPNGAIWIALDNTTAIGDRKLAVGDTQAVAPGKTVQFSCLKGRARIVVVYIKSATQPVTVDAISLKDREEWQDASARRDRLLIAVSSLNLRDTWNLAADSQWKPSKPENIRLKPAAAQWIKAGTHHLKNMQVGEARFAAAEW
jgi:hypothetical protein